MNDFIFENDDSIRRPYSQRKISRASPQPIGLSQMLGLIGSVMLAVGTLLPAVNIPVLGSFSFMQVSHKVSENDFSQRPTKQHDLESLKNEIKTGIPVEGGIILLMAAFSFVLVLVRQEPVLLLTFFICAVCLLVAYVRIDGAFSELLEKSIKEKNLIGVALSATISF